MFAKITIAIALVLGTASGALAAPKQKHNTSRTYVHDTHGQRGGSAARVKTTHTRTARATTTHVKAARETATQVEAIQIEAVQVEARQIEAVQLESRQVEVAQAQPTQAQPTQAQPAQAQPAQAQPTQAQPTQQKATPEKTAPEKTAQVKVTHVKSKHVKSRHVAKRAKSKHVKTAQKQRRNKAYTSYESRSGSFESRHYDRYNTRAQLVGSASGAMAAAKQKHSSNPANDVYDTRGWYIGSDPDANVRFMMKMDPTSTD